MNLLLHGSLGDHVICTGIPQAWAETHNGEFTHVPHQRHHALWKYNPHVIPAPLGDTYQLSFNAGSKDYMIFYPVRVFHDISGHIVDRTKVHPNLYWPSKGRCKNLVVVNDQAGWPTRKGYRWFNDLVQQLAKSGKKVVYLRNEGFLDCMGQHSPRQVTDHYEDCKNPSMEDMIELLSFCELYVGYESGLAQLASALFTPYVLLAGSVAPINVAGDSCIYALEVCPHCNRDNCEHNCLSHAPNMNKEILDAIRDAV